MAFTALGRMYERGDPFPRDAVEAANLYRQVAEAGEVYAQIYLCSRYERGEGVARDTDQAFLWYRKAAEHDDADAHVALRQIASVDHSSSH